MPNAIGCWYCSPACLKQSGQAYAWTILLKLHGSAEANFEVSQVALDARGVFNNPPELLIPGKLPKGMQRSLLAYSETAPHRITCQLMGCAACLHDRTAVSSGLSDMGRSNVITECQLMPLY